MLRNVICKIAIFTAAMAFIPCVLSASTQLQVVDQNGAPVANAVVSLPTDSTSTMPADIAVMDQVDQQFTPTVLVIQKGQRVAFPNSDNVRHHVYSFSEPKTFEIKLYKGLNVDPIEFDKAGVSILGCNIHDNMKGYIFIADNQLAVVTDEQGLANFDVPIPKSVTVWHPQLSSNNNQQVEVETMIKDDKLSAHITLLEPKVQSKTRTFGQRTFGKKS